MGMTRRDEIIGLVASGSKVFVRTNEHMTRFRSFALMPDGRVCWGYFTSHMTCKNCGATGENGLGHSWSGEFNYTADIEEFREYLQFLPEASIQLVTEDEAELLGARIDGLVEEARRVVARAESNLSHLEDLAGRKK